MCTERFFDHYLEGRETWDEPRVRYFRTGTGDGSSTTEGRLCHGGTWKAATDWSLPNTEFANYFAHGDGTLGAERPTDADSSTTYEFGAWRPRATTPMRIR